MLLGWDGSTPLLDRMCGSGTLPIEAALLAGNLPPGGQRQFAFMAWPRFRPGLWQALLAEATRGERDNAISIRCADRDPSAVAAARRNAERAGVQNRVDFSLGELAQTPAAGGTGLLLCNPPYGLRLGREDDLRPLFRSLGDVCRLSLPGWRVAFLAPAEHLARATGLPLRPVALLNNGGIAVTLWQAEKLFSNSPL
jgi:putative N6-adenine-specific DNA methylase